MNINSKPRQKSTVSTASLPDIIFMLLIFFMVTTVMKTFDGLKVQDPSANKIEKLENRKNDSSLETLISENEGLKRQVDSLKAELENSSKDREAHLNIEGLSAELSNLKEEREQEKKELQSLYDQLSAALAASGETV